MHYKAGSILLGVTFSNKWNRRDHGSTIKSEFQPACWNHVRDRVVGDGATGVTPLLFSMEWEIPVAIGI